MSKRNFLRLTTIVLSFGLLLFLGCRKSYSPSVEDINTNLNVESYSKSLMSDTNFSKFVNDFSTALINLRGISAFDNSSPTGGVSVSDVSLAESYKKDISKSIAIFASKNPRFFYLSKENREAVFAYIESNVTNSDFQNNNREIVTPLLLVNDKLVDRIYNSRNSNISVNSLNSRSGKQTVNKLTTNYVIGCALAAIGGALLSYGDAINDIKYVMTQGFTGMALVNMAIDILGAASPWWKVAGIALGFGGCLLTAID